MTSNYYVKSYAPDAESIEGAITSIVDGEKVVLVPFNKEDMYDCVIGSRADFEISGYDTSSLSDSEMQRIFDRIGEVLVGDGGYWESIRYFGEDMPRIDKDDEDPDEEYEE